MQETRGQRTINNVRCPKCEKASLVPLELGDILLDRCERCAGIWFDHGELEAVIGEGGAAHLDPLSDPTCDSASGGPCPRCRVEMRPVTAAKDPTRAIPVDRCPSCMGLWLQRKRLRAIEDGRLLLTVRQLFLSGERDEEIVSELQEEDRRRFEEAAAFICSHPQRTALISHLERMSDRTEINKCRDGED